jgi:DNA-binding transcriptional regulator YdaS (Cro superfamily)
MWLRDWVQREGIGSMRKLARLSGVSYETVRRVVHGLHAPRIENARKLSAATDGEVSVEEVYGPIPAPESDEAAE